MRQRLSIVLAVLSTATVFTVCAAIDDVTTHTGQVVISDEYDAGPTCATAADGGSICAEDDIECNDDLDVGDDATIRGAATIAETLGVTGVTTTTGGLTSVAGTNTINVITPQSTVIDFTISPQAVFTAKTTGAIMTEADTQEDTFYVGIPSRYFELFQDGNNSDNVGTWVVGTTGWVIPGPNATDQGTQVTEGIILGSAHSFLAGTDAAFRLRVAFYIPTRAEINDLMVGFRGLGAYAVADDSTEIATAYDDKIVIGIDANAGVIKQMKSVATVDTTTSCTHAAHTDGDILALEVNVSAARVTSVKVGNATPAGTTRAQIRAGVTAAYAALTADTLCNAAAATLTAGNYVPTIMMNKAAGGASDFTIVDYVCGPQ